MIRRFGEYNMTSRHFRSAVLLTACGLWIHGCTQPFIPIPVTLGGETGLVFNVEPGTPSSRNLPVNLDLSSDLRVGSAALRLGADNITYQPSGAGKGAVIAQGATITVDVTVRIAGSDELESVCDNGEEYGPFEVVFDAEFNVVSIDPSTVTLSDDTVALINSGGFSLCIDVESTDGGTVTINGYTIVVGG